MIARLSLTCDCCEWKMGIHMGKSLYNTGELHSCSASIKLRKCRFTISAN